jgi:hypothetical protein
MKVSNKIKIYGAVLGLAVGAWGVDAAFFSATPAKAVATATPTAAEATTDPAVAAAGMSDVVAAATSESETGIPANWISDRLRAWPGSGNLKLAGLRDAFAAPDAWIARQQPAVVAQSGQAADTFQKSHRLAAVLLDGKGGGRALVNGRLLPVGQSIDGYRLASVTKQSATFASNAGRRVILTLGGQAMPGAEAVAVAE